MTKEGYGVCTFDDTSYYAYDVLDYARGDPLFRNVLGFLMASDVVYLERTETSAQPVDCKSYVFLSKFMNEAEDDLEHVVPVDYVVEPHGFLPKVVH
ncbi:hypothetical protein Tco_0900557 [Tanacetum coccineum]